MFKKNLFTIIYSILLTAFTVYVAMDTFLITRVYSNVPTSEISADQTTSEVLPAEQTAETTSEVLPDAETAIPSETHTAQSLTPVSTESTYQDENITITVTEYQEYNSAIYVADIQLSSPEYLKTALAKSAYGKNVTAKTSEIASANNAILAINGDYYGAQESGYVLRNGVIYRDTAKKGREDLVIYEDGTFEIITETEVTAQELLEKGAVQILSFGPALVIDNEIAVTTNEETGKAMSSNPRTAIGVIDDLHYVFVVSDGRTDASEGLSLYQMAQFMTTLGTEIAYNLDGGGSSSMVFNGTVINNPTTTGNKIKERSVSDIVYIG